MNKICLLKIESNSFAPCLAFIGRYDFLGWYVFVCTEYLTKFYEVIMDEIFYCFYNTNMYLNNKLIMTCQNSTLIFLSTSP